MEETIDGGNKMEEMEETRWRKQDGGYKMEETKLRKQDGGNKMEETR